jgi:polyhydroxyalkanoate synthesis repressor PhaR
VVRLKEAATSGGPRVIKKYPNRRLYDTVESRYIRLGEVRQLVLDRIDFVVIEKKSQKDITRSILLQVIADEERCGEPVMSRDFLWQIIRTYGGPLQGMIGRYLDQSLKLFIAQQREMRERSKGLDGDAMSTLANRNYQRWRAVQDEIYSTLVRSVGKTDSGTGDEEDWVRQTGGKD